MMKIIYNNIIPFKGFCAMNILGVLFVRNDHKNQVTNAVLNHEAIHTAQMKELLYVPFYLLYVAEYLKNLIGHTSDEAYFNISFEKEAYAHQNDFEYLKNRKHYAQWRTLNQ